MQRSAIEVVNCSQLFTYAAIFTKSINFNLKETDLHVMDSDEPETAKRLKKIIDDRDTAICETVKTLDSIIRNMMLTQFCAVHSVISSRNVQFLVGNFVL